MNLNDIQLPVGRKVPLDVEAFFHQLYGREPGKDPVGVEGCTLQIEAALIREERTAYLVVSVGGRVVSLQGLHASLIAHLEPHFAKTGPSPQQQHAQIQREQKAAQERLKEEERLEQREASRKRQEEIDARQRAEAEEEYRAA